MPLKLMKAIYYSTSKIGIRNKITFSFKVKDGHALELMAPESQNWLKSGEKNLLNRKTPKLTAYVVVSFHFNCVNNDHKRE